LEFVKEPPEVGLNRSSPQGLEKESSYGCGQKNENGRFRNARRRRISTTGVPRVPAVAVGVSVILIPEVPPVVTVVVVMDTLVPSPSLAVIVVKISKPVHMVLVGDEDRGLEEGRMMSDQSRVAINEVWVVKIGIGVIGKAGKAVHAVRQKRRRKCQQASQETTNAEETSHLISLARVAEVMRQG